MKEDTRVTQDDIDRARVELKPILGIAPGRYLAGLLVAASAAVLFAIFVLPGLVKPGSVYSFAADPPDAAVYLDGAYLVSGAAPVFVKRGPHTLEVRRAGFEPTRLEFEAPSRLVGSLFFPRRQILRVDLRVAEPSAALRLGIRDFAAWALTGAPSEAYQHPMILSEAAIAASLDPELEAKGLLSAAFSYATNGPAYRDAIRAAAVAYGASAALTPFSLGRAAAAAAEELAAEPALLLALANQLPAEAKAALEASTLFRRARSSLASAPAAPAAAGAVTAAGREFVMLPAGDYALGQARGRLEAFGLARYEVTNAEFRAFVAAKPAWAPAARDGLVAAGLADPRYLSTIDTDPADAPVRHVSRYAALAYCDWLSERAPAGYRVDLPTEAQWAYAAAAGRPSSGILLDLPRNGPEPVGSSGRDAAGFYGLLGNVWEWCADAYAPQAGLAAEARLRWASAEGVVRGGSWANQPNAVELSSRGPMPPSASTPFTGFRPALVRAEP